MRTKLGIFLWALTLPVGGISAQAEASDQAKPPLAPCIWSNPDQQHWFDETHLYVSALICRPSLWFDSFFKNKQHLDRTDGTSVTLHFSENFEQLKQPDFDHKISTKVHLPYFNRKLHLIVEAEKRSWLDDTPGPFDDRELSFVVGDNIRTPRGRVGFQWYFLNEDSYALKGEVHLETPNSNLEKMHGFHRWDPTKDTSITLGEELLRSSHVKVTRKQVLLSDFEFHQHAWLYFDTAWSVDKLWRFSNDLETHGNKWIEPKLSQGLSLMNKIDSVTAVSYDLSWDVSNSPWANRFARVGVNGRSRAFRPWLAIGVAPYFAMYKREGFVPRPGILLSLDVIYGDRST